MLRIRVVQCLCTQCEGELLHLYEVCLPVISVEHMSQVQVWVVGPGFVFLHFLGHPFGHPLMDSFELYSH